MFRSCLIFLATLAVCSVYGQGGSCVSPFLLLPSSTDTCVLFVPAGENGEEYCAGLNEIYQTPNTIQSHTVYDICYYVIGSGDGTFVQGCCGGGLPGRR